MSKTAIGELRERVTIQKPVKTDDNYGGSVLRWNDVCTVWAAVEHVSSRERYFAQQITVDVTHRVKIRSREDIDETMRAIWGGTVLHIETITARGSWMEILCREEKSQ